MVKTAFLFPGQGSQSIGMGKLAHARSSAAKALFEKADEILGFGLSQIMFEGPEDKLRDTAVTQPALFLASAAALELLKEKSLQPSVVAGHSLGEYSALYAAGALNFEDALKLVQERGRAMNVAAAAHPGSMAAIIGLTAPQVEEICKNSSDTNAVCAPANFNTESQIVISGAAAAVTKAMAFATAQGAPKVVALNVSGAFHSPLMSSAALSMAPKIESTEFKDVSVPVVTNVDAHKTTQATEFKKKLVAQIDHAVRWHESMLLILQENVDMYVEVGSGRVLSTMAKKLDRKKTVLATDDMDSIDKAVPLSGVGQ
jgi:[acyl-carrier-protein] S-malonyltransferase